MGALSADLQELTHCVALDEGLGETLWHLPLDERVVGCWTAVGLQIGQTACTEGTAQFLRPYL